ncbi:MAG: ATP-binding protein [Planctomycetota bacterium]|nr:ATP-binding protein [Planctomycetota bacterium]
MLKHTIHEEITVRRSPEEMDELRRFARSALERSKLSDYERGLLLLALDEVLTAIIEFARKGNGEEKVTIIFDINDVRVRIAIEDSQNQFGNDINEEQFRLLSENPARREIDVQFLVSVVDEMSYKFQKGIENKLILTKFIEGGS